MAKRRVTLDDPAYEGAGDEEPPSPDPEAGPIPEPEPEPETEPAPEPEAVPQEPEPEDGEEVARRIAGLLKAPHRRDSLPTITAYNTEMGYSRYFQLDVDGDAFERAWDLYYAYRGEYDPVGFMLIVDRVLGNMPRMYSAVSWVPLKKK